MSQLRLHRDRARAECIAPSSLAWAFPYGVRSRDGFQPDATQARRRSHERAAGSSMIPNWRSNS